jgi:hypothetical protein
MLDSSRHRRETVDWPARGNEPGVLIAPATPGISPPRIRGDRGKPRPHDLKMGSLVGQMSGQIYKF